MTGKQKWMASAVIVALVAAAVIMVQARRKPAAEVATEIRPAIGTIQREISSTATVCPENRLEIKPPIAGRIDEILVKEGERVTPGQVLARMSSTERAALLDAARARGPEDYAYWSDVYKATPLLSPIDAEVIVSKMEPGQTVTAADPVVVLSDRLIVQAQVDETDIGQVRLGQKASISLDAYPAITVGGAVDHIYYESETVNNVTIYKVDIIPETVPAVYRSGMSATVSILTESKEGVLTVPLDAVKRGKEGAYVLVRRGPGAKPSARPVTIGASDEKNAEVLSGLSQNDRVVIVSQKYALSGAPKAGTNPFMPARRGGR